MQFAQLPGHLNDLSVLGSAAHIGTRPEPSTVLRKEKGEEDQPKPGQGILSPKSKEGGHRAGRKSKKEDEDWNGKCRLVAIQGTAQSKDVCPGTFQDKGKKTWDTLNHGA